MQSPRSFTSLMLPRLTGLTRATAHPEEWIDEASVEDIVDVGGEVSPLLGNLRRIADLIRIRLRVASERMPRNDNGSVIIEGRTGQATVSLRDPTFRPAPDADWPKLHRMLGSRFESLFETSYRLRDPNLSGIEDLDPAIRDVLLCSLEQEESTPPIGFGRR